MILARRWLTCNSLNILKRTFSSALYVTGDKAHEVFAVLTPILDFDERLKNKSELEQNLKLRCLNIDLEKVENRWNFYKYLDEQKVVLEITKTEIGKEIVRLKASEEKNEKVIEKLMLHGKLVKDDLKVLKDYLYGVEESAVLNVLSIPNILHRTTPHNDESVIHSFLEKPKEISKFHLDIGVKNNLIEFTNPLFYFLKDDSAIFELLIGDYVSNTLLSSSFTQFSNADFCRSIVIEGCGANFFDKLQVFTLEKLHNDNNHDLSRLHLTGGASLYSFMAYFARHSVKPSYLPLKLFTLGRRYQPLNSDNTGLFNVSQESAVEIFLVTRDDDELENEFKKIIVEIIKIHEPLGHHFRLVYLPANQLKNYESLRLSIQMFSSYFQRYFEIGHCSICDSYLSKRLLFTYPFNKEWRYPKVISGTLLRVQPLLACMLEYNDANKCRDLLPNILKNPV
ncbi:hypothetical protein ILUMI_22262 [Ignelater luminosus]|uniref:serine--tRNA ligase n=1 Tax=Ignelater luminosus TaxID=2038154 RepID=A0A8K0CES0_IGNLU|nr:hypothetical protein ILUMI_22262 [Ignelater luminosus]